MTTYLLLCKCAVIKKRMRFRSKKYRLCRISVGTLCVLALLYVVWLKNDVAGRGHLTVDNGRRQASSGENVIQSEDVVGTEVLQVTEAHSRWFTGTEHISPISTPDETSKDIGISALLDTSPTFEDMILDPSKVKITPKHPIVLEGHPTRLTCVAKQLLANNASAAPYMTFQLPDMSNKDRRSVQLQLRPGAAVVSIRSVRRSHQGVYTCVMVDHDGKHRYNTAQLHVKERGEGYIEVNEGAEYDDNGVVELGGMEIQAADPGDVEKVDKSQILQLRQKLDSDLQIVTDIDQLLDRGKLQEQQVEKFCVKYNLSHQAYQLPGQKENEKSLSRHLLVYDKMKTLFSFVPKTGCTNLKLVFFLVQGYIPLSQFLQSRDAVDQNRIESAQFQESFFSRNDHQRQYALKNYFKFVMYRNPLDRLVSGYRSKVARFPLVGFSRDKPHYNWLRSDVLLETQPKKFQEFIHHRGNMSINITFSDFIDYWVRQPKEIKFDEHFRSIFSIAQPCRVRYNFYGNFKDFDRDSYMLLYKIKANPQYLRQGYYSTNSAMATDQIAPGLYAQLSMEQKLNVLKVLALDLDFYYHIFPQEKDVHKSLLGVAEDLPMATLDTITP